MHLKLAFRQLRRHGGFAASAVLSLALGIGANSALFSMFNSLLWAPLPVEAPNRLVAVYAKRDQQSFYQSFSNAEYRDYRDQNTVFDGLTAYTPLAFSVKASDGEPVRAFGELVGGNYFDVLKVRMRLGRGFLPEEDRTPGTHPVAVISYPLWQRKLAGDPTVVGRTLELSGQAFTIVGVTPEGFKGAYAPYFAPELWVPMMSASFAAPNTPDILENRERRYFRVMGRLKDGVSVPQAQAAVSAIAARLAQDYPDTNRGVTAHAFREIDTRPEVEIAPAANAVALTFLALTALVLLVACANVANLLLARGVARQKEIAVRLAVGAGRGALVRQLLTEALVLAGVAGGLGVAIGVVATRLLASYQIPTDLPLVLDVRMDWRAVAFTLALSGVAALVFGLAPALRSARADLLPALKSEVAPTAGRRRWTAAHLLVVGQVATTTVLLVVAGLFVRSVGGATTIDPGFTVDRRIVMSFDTDLQRFDEARSATFYRRLSDDVRALPGVADASLAWPLPLDFQAEGEDVVVEGRQAEPGRETELVLYSRIDERFAEVTGTRLRRGRWPTPFDTATSRKVVVVNEAMAEQFWPGQDPIGRRLQFRAGQGDWFEVIGVAATGKYRQLTEAPRPYMYVPFSQSPSAGRTLVVAMAPGVDVASTFASIRHAVSRIDPAMAMFDAKTMDQFMERAYLGPKLAALLVGPAALLGLVIAAIGLYGAMAYWVSRRTREIGIRAAIGARQSNVVGLVLGQGLRLAGAGLAVGVAAAFLSAQLVANLLFGVTPTDPVVFFAVPALLVVVVLVALLVPVRRALAIDPMRALRID